MSVTPLTNAEDGANTNGSTDATHGNAANGKDGGAGCKAAAQPAERASSDEAVDVAEKDVTRPRAVNDDTARLAPRKSVRAVRQSERAARQSARSCECRGEQSSTSEGDAGATTSDHDLPLAAHTRTHSHANRRPSPSPRPGSRLGRYSRSARFPVAAFFHSVPPPSAPPPAPPPPQPTHPPTACHPTRRFDAVLSSHAANVLAMHEELNALAAERALVAEMARTDAELRRMLAQMAISDPELNCGLASTDDAVEALRSKWLAKAANAASVPDLHPLRTSCSPTDDHELVLEEHDSALEQRARSSKRELWAAASALFARPASRLREGLTLRRRDASMPRLNVGRYRDEGR